MNPEAKNDIWVIGDLRSQRLFKLGLNLLAKARVVTAANGGQTRFVVIASAGETTDECRWTVNSQVTPASAQAEAIRHGADHVLVLDLPDSDVPRADVHAVLIADLVKVRGPRLVLFPLTDFGREAAARAACICRSGLIADCVDIQIEDDRIVAVCPAWGGKITARLTYSDPHRTGFATVQAHQFAPIEAAGSPGAVERVATDHPQVSPGLELAARAESLENSRGLESADVVVVGGAGLASAAGFEQVRELAAAIGAEVGATRPPVLEHWIEEERLIGQTGKTVHPRLLFSIGTSGAVQYTAGIVASEMVVAVNRDPEAPIFQMADIGVVEDAQVFLPLLIERFKKAAMRRLADDLCAASEDAAGSDRFGERIKKLRAANSWTQADLARATGQPPEFIQSVEAGRVSPPVSFLIRLAKAFGVDAGTFLHKSEKSMVRDLRAQAFVRRTQNYSYQTLTPGAENDHLRAFMVTIDSHQTHKPVAYKHEGEEFIYVMDGDLEFTLGGKPHTLKAGEYIHFNSDIPHKLKSLSNRPTRCLVVLYTT
jgi:electron transfer flavoprotein alpha subunit/quercetin dioxygenase-like cupin family protein